MAAESMQKQKAVTHSVCCPAVALVLLYILHVYNTKQILNIGTMKSRKSGMNHYLCETFFETDNF
jgi:hypothetical protein